MSELPCPSPSNSNHLFNFYYWFHQYFFFRFSHLNTEVILSRLVFRKHYAIAIQVAKHLNLPESWILEHWAYHKVMNDPSELLSFYL